MMASFSLRFDAWRIASPEQGREVRQQAADAALRRFRDDRQAYNQAKRDGIWSIEMRAQR